MSVCVKKRIHSTPPFLFPMILERGYYFHPAVTGLIQLLNYLFMFIVMLRLR